MSMGMFLYVVLPDIILKVVSSTSDFQAYCTWELAKSYYHCIKDGLFSSILVKPLQIRSTNKKQGMGLNNLFSP